MIPKRPPRGRLPSYTIFRLYRKGACWAPSAFLEATNDQADP